MDGNASWEGVLGIPVSRAPQSERVGLQVCGGRQWKAPRPRKHAVRGGGVVVATVREVVNAPLPAAASWPWGFRATSGGGASACHGLAPRPPTWPP